MKTHTTRLDDMLVSQHACLDSYATSYNDRFAALKQRLSSLTNPRARLWLIPSSEGAMAHRANFLPQSSLRDVLTMPLVPMVSRGPPRQPGSPTLLMMLWTLWGLSHRLALHIEMCTTTPHRRLLAEALTPPGCSQTTARSPSRVGILVPAWAAQL